MKTFNKMLLIAALLFAAGCADDDPAYLQNQEKEEPTVSGDTHGYLSASTMSMRIVLDSATETGDDNTGGDTTQPASLGTRTEPDTDAFTVEILDASDTRVLSTTYGALKTQLAAEPLSLAVGSYTLNIRSEASAPAAAWEHPVYGGTKQFQITKAATKENPAQIGEVVCTLQNIKVTFAISVDLKDKLTADTQATVSLGENSLPFLLSERRAGYFLPLAQSNTLKFQLSGKFADTQSPVQLNKTLTNVKAGQWRKITLVITYADKGGIKFDIHVDSFVQDETVYVDGTEGLWEQLYEETPLVEAPSIGWTDHDLTKPFQLKASMFDTEGKCTEPFDLSLTAPGRVASFEVNISSTNSDFIGALGIANVPESFDLCTITPTHPAYALLSAFGFPLGEALQGAAEKHFSLGGAMPQLYLAPGFDGEHTFAFSITDEEGQNTRAALVIVVDRNNEGGAPTIVWKDYDIDRQYDLKADMQIDIDFTAPAGIRSLVVTIISESLDVTDVGLPDTFDLANITDPALIKTLGDPDPAGFGFPINDKVKDQTSVPFSITPFVKLLIGFEGLHKFQIDLTDNNGEKITKTVQLNVPKQ